MRAHVVSALDIGSRHLTYVVGVREANQLVVQHVIQTPSAGIRKARVVHLQQLQSALRTLLEAASKQLGSLPNTLLLAQSGAHLQNLHHTVSLHFPCKHTITQADVDQLQQAAIYKNFPQETVSLYQTRKGYTVDHEWVANPIGYAGMQLHLYVDTLLGQTQPIKDLLSSVNQFGFRVHHLIFSGIASAWATTTDEERGSGICVIDIGAQITDFVVYKNHTPQAMGTVPVGGDQFTNDLCSAFRLTTQEAEALEEQFGIPTEEHGACTIPSKDPIPSQKVRTVLLARAQELFTFIHNTITKGAFSQMCANGVVLTGGGALLKNIGAVAANVFQCDCCIRSPIMPMMDDFKHPSNATAIGLLCYDSPVKPVRRVSLWNRLTALFTNH